MHHEAKSPEGISSIDDAVAAGHVRGAVRGQVHSQIVQLVHCSQPLLRDPINPYFLLGIQRWHAIQGGVHVSWAD
jgi:hypothetical protein